MAVGWSAASPDSFGRGKRFPSSKVVLKKQRLRIMEAMQTFDVTPYIFGYGYRQFVGISRLNSLVISCNEYATSHGMPLLRIEGGRKKLRPQCNHLRLWGKRRHVYPKLLIHNVTKEKKGLWKSTDVEVWKKKLCVCLVGRKQTEDVGNKVISYGLCRNVTEVKINTVGLTIGSISLCGAIHTVLNSPYK